MNSKWTFLFAGIKTALEILSTVDDDFRAFCLPEVDEKVDLEVDEMGITVHWRQAQFETWMQRTNYMDKLRVTSYEVSISPPDTDENIVTVEKYKTSMIFHDLRVHKAFSMRICVSRSQWRASSQRAVPKAETAL